jgi:predicted amidohydrolase YtcJ
MGPDDVARMRALTVIPSVQPTHATSDAPWAGLRLGRNRLHRAYAYRDLQSAIGMLTLGTDFPVESIDPRLTFYAATARRNAQGEPKDGFQLEQALTPLDAMRGMTVWTALANFLENDLGTIEPGKWADFTVVDRDLLEVSAEEAREARVIRTFIAGK